MAGRAGTGTTDTTATAWGWLQLQGNTGTPVVVNSVTWQEAPTMLATGFV